MRVHTEIQRIRTEKGGADLHDQLLLRIEMLGGNVDLTENQQNRGAFAEVLDAYVPENHTLVEDAEELERVQHHAQEIIDALGGGLDASSLTHPVQFYRLGDPTEITFGSLPMRSLKGGTHTRTSPTTMESRCTMGSRSAGPSF